MSKGKELELFSLDDLYELVSTVKKSLSIILKSVSNIPEADRPTGKLIQIEELKEKIVEYENEIQRRIKQDDSHIDDHNHTSKSDFIFINYGDTTNIQSNGYVVYSKDKANSAIVKNSQAGVIGDNTKITDGINFKNHEKR